jgi:hypothetical protein
MDHQTRLADLPAGAARDDYLAEYAQTKQEREKLCNFRHNSVASGQVSLGQQALLRY